MLLALLTPACVVVHELSEEDVFTSAATVDALVIDGESGDVTVRGTDADVATVTRTLRWTGEDRPESTIDETGGTLELRGGCPPLALFCSVDWEVELPRAAVMDLDIGAGDVDLFDTSGEIRATIGSGDARLDGLGGILDVHTGSGDLTLSALSNDAVVATSSGDIAGDGLSCATLDASTSSGDVRLVFAADASTEEIIATSSSGDVSVTAPGGAWDLDVWTGSGDVSLFGVEDDSEAGRHLSAHTSSGDIEIVGG